MNSTTTASQALSLAEWRAAPDDIKAGVFEEVVELREQGSEKDHWAWPFVKSFFEED